MGTPDFVRAAVRRLPPYRGISPERPPLCLDGNENPLGPPPEALRTLAAVGATVLSRYPSAERLKARWAEVLEVQTDELLMTPGSGPGLALTAELALDSDDVCLLAAPSFELYAWAALRRNARVRTVPCGHRLSFPAARFRRALSEKPQPRLAFIGHPDNPTGRAPALAVLDDLTARHPATLFVIDEAYFEFYGQTAVSLAAGGSNVLVLRTLSKAYGLAGVRIGAVIGNALLIELLGRINAPYPVTGPAAAMGLAALDSTDHVARTVAVSKASCGRIARGLANLGVAASRTRANFVLADFGAPARARVITEVLAARGIAVRDRSHLPQMRGLVRISAGTDNETDRLLDELRLLLSPIPDALLFDMDGVLVDVRRSYDEAIWRTVRSFLPRGVHPQRTEVLAVKNRADANDDVDAARIALRALGLRPPPEEIKRRFQRFYLGSDGTAGLCRRERWLVRRRTLERLAARFALGIVTGRPRAEAEMALDLGGVANCFATVITLDDVRNRKPDPAPVRAAVTRLGVSTAWMVGDSPADLVAGRRAGVTTIGIVAEAWDGEGAERYRALRRCRPLAVLPRASDLAAVFNAREELRTAELDGRA